MTTPTPDHTPGRRDPEGRRRAILSAAAELIVENGAASLTHRAVAKRAQVALASTTQYFRSIDDLREQALQKLADEIDAELEDVERLLTPFEAAVERTAQSMHEFLLDRYQARASLALVAAAMSDDSLIDLARRWTDRLTEMLARHAGEERGLAISLYLDGATMHAVLHDEPVSTESIVRAINAILAMPDASKED